ncbi:MAG TPA: hypothetical protein DCY13_17235 [Verrucomicrobiales bacterium]|nr:hypothetical protein [Verrucomicrobiales bacterium]
MSQKTAPRINKLPFLVTDLVFIGVALAIIYRSQTPIGGSQMLAVIACVALGAWACVTPFLRDHEVGAKFAESNGLAETVAQIGQLKLVAAQIQGATAQWQTFQENAGKASEAMKQMSSQLAADAANFAESLQKSSDAEKAALRLEVEKRKRAEADWLKVQVALLDHVFALHQAGLRSGQPNVIQQLGAFQAACRDVVRRLGLVAVEAPSGTTFNPAIHRLPDENQQVPAGASIAATLAPGFSFQGQLVRPVLVELTESSSGTFEGKAADESPDGPVPDAGAGSDDFGDERPLV